MPYCARNHGHEMDGCVTSTDRQLLCPWSCSALAGSRRQPRTLWPGIKRRVNRVERGPTFTHSVRFTQSPGS